jgi:cholesterol transport system auxiliary component
MKNTLKLIAAYAHPVCFRGLFVAYFLSLAGCALPTAPARPAVYDFGAGSLQPTPASATRPLVKPPLILGEIEASPALDSTAMLYRLAYANPQQLQPYAQARWSMPPAQLLRQRLRAHLGEHHALLNAGDSLLSGTKTAPSLNLRLELEEFSQLFDTPELSTGLLRLRATLTQASPTGQQLINQRSFTLQRPAPSPDAAGGVQALSAASEAVALEVEAWVAGVGR